MLGFLHNQVIQEIQSLSQVTTDVGYSRAFIRKSINEGLLSSYLQNIRKSKKSLKKYYHEHAFLFDGELVETAETLLTGIESYVEFDLPCNSSLLNVWNDAPLQLSGLYSVPLRSVPIASGEDVAGSIVTSSQNIDIPNRASVLSDIYSASISNSIFTNSPGSIFDDDDDRMAKLLRKVDSEDNTEEATEQKGDDPSTSSDHLPSDILKSHDDDTIVEPMTESYNESIGECATMGNSISGLQSWSGPIPDQEEEDPEADRVIYRRNVSILSATVDNHSFESLWNAKVKRSTTNFKEVWDRFEKTLEITETEENERCDGFEVVKSPATDRKSIQELQTMVEVLCRLSTECGLDSQGFLCKECKAQLGVDFSKATVCGFDGHYYCSACISCDKFSIPAKIIYNWDFKTYPVSTKAANFLTEYQFKPFIDFKVKRISVKAITSQTYMISLFADTQSRYLLIHRTNEPTSKTPHSTQFYSSLHLYMLRQHNIRASAPFIWQRIYL